MSVLVGISFQSREYLLQVITNAVSYMTCTCVEFNYMLQSITNLFKQTKYLRFLMNIAFSVSSLINLNDMYGVVLMRPLITSKLYFVAS